MLKPVSMKQLDETAWTHKVWRKEWEIKTKEKPGYLEIKTISVQ